MQHVYRSHVKRYLDILLAAALLLILSPVLGVAYLLVRLTSSGPAFYTQPRVGHREVPFTIYKFRSMYVDHHHDPHDQVRSGHSGVTPVGGVLRRLKIDELPQLWNVLIGDMSMVGPRPTLQEHLSRYTPRQRGRYNVVPGITGWAQVNGNIELSLEERIEHDLWYIDNLSLWLDVRILLMTFGVVLLGEQVRRG